MKKFVSALLVLAIFGSAMAASKFTHKEMVEFKCDANAYSAAKDSKKTNNVVQKGSVAQVRCVSGKFVKLRVNPVSKKTMWFRVCDLKNTENPQIWVVWAKGGKGMSSRDPRFPILGPYSFIKGLYVKVSGHTNLRRTPSLHCKSQGVVEKDTMLKLTGRYAYDDRQMAWYEVDYKCKKLWVSKNFVTKDSRGLVYYYNKDGEIVDIG